MTGPTSETLAELAYLRSTRAIRERAEFIHALALRDELPHFRIDEGRMHAIADRVAQSTLAAYPDPKAVPYHSRLRHFEAGGVDRVSSLSQRLSGLQSEEQLMSLFELVITSVLLDAGAGPVWTFREPNGSVYGRSEGLALASYHAFTSGVLSSAPDRAPFRADAERLSTFESRDLFRAFQVGPDNPLVGVEGRASLLRRLGQVVLKAPRYFGADAPRLGHLGLYLRARAEEGKLAASTILETVLDAFSEVWPGRERCAGQNLGDVFRHPLAGLVPFHKLSQWLSYSLCEVLEQSGLVIVRLDDLTGLPEYRNGGLYVDGGVLVPKHPGVLGESHSVGSSVVVEWRALTVALLDRTAVTVRRLLGVSPEEFPLAKVLEGGTWRVGREFAFARRADGSPPIRVESDGTVF